MKLVFGIGINDADYPTQRKLPAWICPYYKTWKSMLGRCYYDSEKYRPYYNGVTVCEEWLTFSNFKAWMENQSWEDCQLDKDIILEGNKMYSPEFCCFVPRYINILLTDRQAARGDYPIGVSYKKNCSKFVASIRDVTSKYLGLFDTPDEAHRAWRKAKAKIIENRVAQWSEDDSFHTKAADALLARMWKLMVD